MFLGDLFGLVLAEISFETDEDLDGFPKPVFALAEVTNNEIFSGGRLSQLTFADIRREIQQKRLWLIQGLEMTFTQSRYRSFKNERLRSDVFRFGDYSCGFVEDS